MTMRCVASCCDLELALVSDEVAFGQFDLGGDFLLQLRHQHAGIPGGRLDRDGETALAVFAADDVRSLGLAHVRHQRERDVLAGAGFDGQVREFFR